jgi:hypothetical protein
VYLCLGVGIAPPAQARWFAIEKIFDPLTSKQFMSPKGALCWICGSLAESWPLLTTEEIKTKLRSDFVFQFYWEQGQQRLAKNVGENTGFRMTTVSKHVVTGIRSSWPAFFISSPSFKEFFKATLGTKGLPLKVSTIRNPDGNDIAGVILRSIADLPLGCPCSRVELFSETSSTHIEYLLETPDALHPNHGANLRQWQEDDATAARAGNNLAICDIDVAPNVESVLATIEAYEKDLKQKEKELGAGRCRARGPCCVSRFYTSFHF